jgi:hypothetical protein
MSAAVWRGEPVANAELNLAGKRGRPPGDDNPLLIDPNFEVTRKSNGPRRWLPVQDREAGRTRYSCPVGYGRHTFTSM